jgi:predicted RNase H-like nuclease (RuvC/YqgF family)
VIVNLEEQYNLLLQVESKRKTGISIKDAYISSLKKQLKEKDEMIETLKHTIENQSKDKF